MYELINRIPLVILVKQKHGVLLIVLVNVQLKLCLNWSYLERYWPRLYWIFGQ